MKIGLDQHGVLDNIPLFKVIGELLVSAGHEVHIITGKQWNAIKYELSQNNIFEGIHYTHHFSITDYLLQNGHSVRWEDQFNPWFDTNSWNPVKGNYCFEHNIDVHFDDTEVYADFFNTPIFIRKK